MGIHSSLDSSSAMFKALAVVIFAATMMVDTSVGESKWYLIETEHDGVTEPTPEPETTPCPFEDNSDSCDVLANHCDDAGISSLCGKTCKCDKGSAPSWRRRQLY